MHAREDRTAKTGVRRDPVAFPHVTIAGRRVGPGEATLIVAEAGVNHNGCVETALRLVDAAAEAGADAVKFQMFKASELATDSAPTAPYQKERCGEGSQKEMLSRLELTMEDFNRIRRRCDDRSILFVATPFGKADLARLVELTPAAVKIASTDLTNTPLLDAAAATGLPMILSTGAATAEEIHVIARHLRQLDAVGRVVLLHCVSCYPTPLSVVNLRAIAALQRDFETPVGLSDHTTSVAMGGWAVAAGACALEKHFTMDPSAPGPDQSMSLDPGQLARYIAGARESATALGDGRIGMTELETEVREIARKSVVAAVDIAAGAKLSPDMLTLKRPGTGIPAIELEGLIGLRAAADIPSDTILSWKMVQ